jgi:hypothetical protein
MVVVVTAISYIELLEHGERAQTGFICLKTETSGSLL